MMQIKALGNFLGDVEKHIKNIEKSVQVGVSTATNGLKAELRSQVISAGLGKKVANAWRSKVNPDNGYSLNATGAVWTNAREIIDSNVKGSTIQGKQGQWIVIPMEAAGKVKHGKNMLKDWQARHGRLRFIYGKNGKNSYLVAENMRARTGRRGGFTRASDAAIKKGRVATVPVFLVIPRAKMKKRLPDPKASFNRWSARLSDYIRIPT